jgi:virulence factor
MENKMKVSVIGLGGIAKKSYLPILAANNSLELQLFSRSQSSIQKSQAIWKIEKSAEDLSGVFKWKPDVAFVLTNSPAHYEILKKLLANDIDVFVEKPATLHVDQTIELAELARSNNKICMVGFNRRYTPIHQRGKEYWGNRKIELAEFTKLRTKPFHDDIRSHIYDDTIHLLDTMRYYCGEVALAHKEIRIDDFLVTCTGMFTLNNGGIAVVKNCMRSGEWRENYILSGDGLTMDIESFSKLTIFQGDEQRSWKENYPAGSEILLGRGFSGEINHFLNCIRTRENPQTDLADSAKTQKLVEAITDG